MGKCQFFYPLVMSLLDTKFEKNLDVVKQFLFPLQREMLGEDLPSLADEKSDICDVLGRPI